MCIKITGTFSAATNETIAASKRSALMSLTISAPASRAARATVDLYVSMEIGAATARRKPRTTGNTRASSSFFGYRLSPRTGRFTADVDNIRAARGHHHAIGDRLLGIVTPPAIEKRIRRHIDDSHDQSAAREIELAVASRQGSALSCHRR